jgi:TadE-like protein
MGPDLTWSRATRGSAAADFALVSGLLVLVFLAVIQLAVAIHVRATLVASAAEGARTGAGAGRTLADGAQRTRSLIRTALSADYAGDVQASYAVELGVRVVVVQVRAPLPLIGLVGPSGDLVVTAHAIVEQP